MTHNLEVNFNKMTPFLKEETTKEIQNHAVKNQDTCVGAVDNAEVAEIECAVSHARNRVRAATIKKFDIKENIQFEHIDHDRLPRSTRQCRERKKSSSQG